MDIASWFSEKFAQPLCHYYTIEATVTYGIILILAVAATYKLLGQLKIKIDRRFLLAILPFIIYGGWTRALRDHLLGIYESNLWCSPPIYFMIFALALGSLLIGTWLERKKILPYERFMWIIAGLLLLYDLSLTRISNWEGFGIILGLALFWAIIFYLINRLFPKCLTKINAGILWSHLLDASSTFTALSFFGYYEQHVVPTFLINLGGPWVMFPLKLIVVWTVLYVLDREEKDEQLRNFLKIIILVLGLALGIRDWLTISLI